MTPLRRLEKLRTHCTACAARRCHHPSPHDCIPNCFCLVPKGPSFQLPAVPGLPGSLTGGLGAQSSPEGNAEEASPELVMGWLHW